MLVRDNYVTFVQLRFWTHCYTTKFIYTYTYNVRVTIIDIPQTLGTDEYSMVTRAALSILAY